MNIITTEIPPNIPQEPEALHCMEVWGGNRITNQVVRAANISIAIHARPHG